MRSFGQVFAFKGNSLSVGVRGPVTVRTAVSVSPVDVSTMQITKSVNSEEKAGKASDTMGSKTAWNLVYINFVEASTIS